MNLALFDFDGTITNRETFGDFMNVAVSPSRLLLGKLLLWPWIIGYKLGICSGSRARAVIVRFAFAGVSLDVVERCGVEFAHGRLCSVLRADMLDRIEWHKSRGDTVVVVSGGFDVYLRHWCAARQIALICSVLDHHKGVLSGRYAGRQCVLEEKARRVRAAYDLTVYERIYAYGDTQEDLALLALAHERYYRGQRVQ
jgi:HAD superfamily hydrolase (TIGR01490 family)